MSRIKILSASVVNKIAAGEVIDRPASVVKELIENAIDAKASRIDTYLEDGGRKLIRVVDDGIGMDADDLVLAFESHATSKLKDADDLFAVHTLGFRGEALPSIGAVSHAGIVSRTKGALQGAEIKIDGGILGEAKERGAPEGTQVEVRDLFFNVPVRKKFLKAVPTEMAYISEALTKFSLSYPAIHFTLTHNGRKVFNLPPVNDTAERIATLFGEEMRKHLIPILQREETFMLSGYIVPPFFDKANARMQFIFLNGRFIKDSAIFRAINEAYRGKLMHKRYPIVFLFLQIEPSEVDVNVHPTKTEVRFRNTSAIYNHVLAALKEGLSKSSSKPATMPSFIEEHKKGSDLHSEDVELVKKSLWEQFSLGKADKDPASSLPQTTPIPGFGRKDERAPPPYIPSREEGSFTRKASGHSGNQATLAGREEPGMRGDINLHGEAEREKVDFPPEGYGRQKRTAFQVHNAFIIEETEEGLNIIDQHALHEIILFHEIESNLQNTQPASQRLLIPELIELSPKDFFIVLGLREHLESLGIAIEEFGRHTIAVRSFPQILKRVNAREFIENVLSVLEEDDSLKDKGKVLNKLTSIMACKAAIKAGQKLDPLELAELLEKRNTVNVYTNNCPHGRPTTLHFSLDELQKQFKRK